MKKIKRNNLKRKVRKLDIACFIVATLGLVINCIEVI
jgi:hypothetical protein